LAGVTRGGLGDSADGPGDASASFATFRPFDLPSEDLLVIEIRALPMLSLRLRRADMDFLREVWPIRGDEPATRVLLRCEKVSVQRGNAVTPTGIRGEFADGAAV
jgi:hypothetical protein